VFAHREQLSSLDSTPYEQLDRVVKGSSIRASTQDCILIQNGPGHHWMDVGILEQLREDKSGRVDL
jgi:hypothetical protein